MVVVSDLAALPSPSFAADLPAFPDERVAGDVEASLPPFESVAPAAGGLEAPLPLSLPARDAGGEAASRWARLSAGVLSVERGSAGGWGAGEGGVSLPDWLTSEPKLSAGRGGSGRAAFGGGT
ncbi:hypothetical protein [Bradyrhizobium sp. NP1]|uniref:hypothetical protein n=1 Tax=Bradyrhizobium sp. NP1 TaxID=3049772 RepID=UPI0025A5554A|nr:hypothetical protein [Bradyrhizobium sp. NP1]WJR79744.1 hypothetical protein QOU61_08240 [Bradyrhizobium sp. NP1]